MRLFKNRVNPGSTALVAMLLLCTAYVHWPVEAHGEKRQRFLSAIPAQIGPWSMSREADLTQGEKEALGAEDYVLRWYRRGEDEVLLYVAFFTSKHGNITHNPEKCYPGSGFFITRRAITSCPSPEGGDFPAIRVVPVRDTEKHLVLYWFQEGDQVIVDKWEHVAKVLTRAILYNRTESFMVRVSMDFTTDQEMPERTRILQEFAGLARVQIEQALHQGAS